MFWPRRSFLSIALALFPNISAGQSTLIGIVRSETDGSPLAGVEVLLSGTGLSARTGANGRFVLENPPAGIRELLFRAIGFLPVRMQVAVDGRDTVRANASLIPGEVRLPTIEVEGAIPRPKGVGIEAFEERRRLGFGKFYDALELRKMEHLRLDDLLRRKGGVEVQPKMVDGQRIWVALNPYRRTNGGVLACAMQVYLDGSKIGTGGWIGARRADLGTWEGAYPPDLRQFELSSLEAIEVYRSTAQVPTEYGGATASCGVLLLWSRRNP